MPIDPPADRFERAIAAIDAANAEDPNRLDFSGETYPKELIHAQRASHWLEVLRPDASELLRLAVRAHHLRRWQLPRDSHPMGRAGYHAWRRALQGRHAEEAGVLLAAAGYGAEEIARVGDLIRKKGLGRDPEAQAFEDALCLVFVEIQLDAFSRLYDEEKVVGVLERTLPKMSEAARQFAATIATSERASALLTRAVERFTQA